jgi:outer membrane protein insertion porin family
MKKMTARTGFSLFLLMSFLLPAGAGQMVKDIVIRNSGPGQPDEGYVRTHVSVKAGSGLEPGAISKDVKALLATGRFSWVRTEVETVDGGIRIVYLLSNKYQMVNPVRIQGCDYYRESKFREYLGLYPGDLVDDQVLGTRVKQIIDKYRQDYFPDVKVTWKIDETDRAAGTADVTVKVEEGLRAKVRRVEFTGNKVVSSNILRKSLKQPAWYNPFWWLKKKRYDPGEFEAAKADIVNQYLMRGYVDAKVDIREIAYDRGNLKVIVNIEEGPVYKFGKITISGGTLFPEKDLKRCVFIKEGIAASSELLRLSVQTLQDFYGSRGYIDAMVRPVMETDSAGHIMNVNLSIVEGTQSKIRNIRIEGNTRTKDKVIRRELLVYPGDVYDQVRVKRSEKIVSNLGFFKDGSVRSYPAKTPVAEEKDLVLEVEEKRTGQFMVSAGFSSVDDLIGMVELSQGNFDLFGWPYFTGGGQKLKLSTQFGSKRKLYEISFVEPWFLDRKLSLGVDLYVSDLSYDDYDIERKGVAITLGKALTRTERIELQYCIEKELLKDISDTNAYANLDSGDTYFFSNEPETTNSTVQLTLIHDTRDNPFIPTRGNRTSIFGSISGGWLGFETDVYKLGIRMNQYFPLWFGHVLSLKARAEVVDTYSDMATVPIMDRLFLGGGRTLRGFEYRDVGPKAVRKSEYDSGLYSGFYRPLGGKSLGMATVEYIIPLVSMVRLALFVDAGNVWSDVYDFQLDDLAVSAGVGFRLDFPGFPIKVDWGHVISKDDPLTAKEPWVIWIGPDY